MLRRCGVAQAEQASHFVDVLVGGSSGALRRHRAYFPKPPNIFQDYLSFFRFVDSSIQVGVTVWDPF